VAEYKLICCIVNMGDASKVLKVARRHGVKEGIITIGKGTVNNRVLTFLKLNEVRKEIVSMVVDATLATEAIKGISKDMAFEKPHHGIAFTHPVSELLGSKHKAEKNTEMDEVENSMYHAIYVIVERGTAEEVVEAANKAGARGATIVNARGSGSQETQRLFSIEIEPEKEKVIIIAKAELKDGIVEAVKKQMGIDEPGNGILFVLDVNEAYGLHQG
jgi:Nitrogen regulatory protein PII